MTDSKLLGLILVLIGVLIDSRLSLV